MNLKIITIIIFFILFSCKTKSIQDRKESRAKEYVEKLNLEPRPFLQYIKTGLINKTNSEFFIEDYNIKFKDNSNKGLEDIYINDKLTISIVNNLNKNYLFEVFNDEYLIISKHISFGAADSAEMKRTELYLIQLSNTNNIFFIDNIDNIRICMNGILLSYYMGRPNSKELSRFAIKSIDNEKLTLLSSGEEIITYEMKKFEGNVVK